MTSQTIPPLSLASSDKKESVVSLKGITIRQMLVNALDDIEFSTFQPMTYNSPRRRTSTILTHSAVTENTRYGHIRYEHKM